MNENTNENTTPIENVNPRRRSARKWILVLLLCAIVISGILEFRSPLLRLAEKIDQSHQPLTPAVVAEQAHYTFQPVKLLATSGGMAFWLVNVSIDNPSNHSLALYEPFVTSTGSSVNVPGEFDSAPPEFTMSWAKELSQTHSLFPVSTEAGLPSYPNVESFTFKMAPHTYRQGSVVIPLPVGESSTPITDAVPVNPYAPLGSNTAVQLFPLGTLHVPH